MDSMRVQVHESIEDIPAAAWNALAGTDNPFLRHEFLAALERHGCVGPHVGWQPRHLAAYARDGSLAGVVPLYLKHNSYGEFVFDWSWADAYHRAGLAYYPKLVAAIPYTPATGRRLLAGEDRTGSNAATALIEHALQHARERGVSSLHWLFPPREQAELLSRHALLLRTGCQFHWSNPGYRDFDDFLDRFTAQKRKKLKRERRHVAEAGVELEVLHGHEMSETQWKILHDFYCSTFERKSGVPTLTLPFFHELSRTMGDALVLVMARHAGRYVAGAINLRGSDALYGRHWGCQEAFNGLHFEACYYQGIDYCIRHGLKRFEPGAQGEHKISRGFVPTVTWSAHWIAQSEFRRAVAEFLVRERAGIDAYMRELGEHLPFKAQDASFADTR